MCLICAIRQLTPNSEVNVPIQIGPPSQIIVIKEKYQENDKLWGPFDTMDWLAEWRRSDTVN